MNAFRDKKRTFSSKFMLFFGASSHVRDVRSRKLTARRNILHTFTAAELSRIKAGTHAQVLAPPYRRLKIVRVLRDVRVLHFAISLGRVSSTVFRFAISATGRDTPVFLTPTFRAFRYTTVSFTSFAFIVCEKNSLKV